MTADMEIHFVQIHRAYGDTLLNHQLDLLSAIHKQFETKQNKEGKEGNGEEEEEEEKKFEGGKDEGVLLSMFLMPDIKNVVMIPQVFILVFN